MTSRLLMNAIAFGITTWISFLSTTGFAIQSKSLDLKGLYPPCGQIGTNVDVVLRSEPSNWPLNTWIDREGLIVTCQEQKGHLQFQVSAQAIPGTYWLRFYNEQGASTLLPFYVDSCPQQSETEPNNRPDNGNELSLPMAMYGRLDKRGDVDSFRVKLKSEQRLNVVVFARRPFGSPMDAVMQICDADGRVLDQNDDERGIDPQLLFKAPHEGTYLVRLYAFPETANSTIAFSGDVSFVYRLELSIGERFELSQLADQQQSARDSLLFEVHETRRSFTIFNKNQMGSAEVETRQFDQTIHVPSPHFARAIESPNSSAQGRESPLLERQPFEVLRLFEDTDNSFIQTNDLPAEAWGTIAQNNEWDRFRIALNKDDRIRIVASSRSMLQQLDPVVAVFDSQGNEVIRQDDEDRNERDVDFVFKAPESGVYEIKLGDATARTGRRFTYRLQLLPVRPQFQLSVTQERLLLSTDQKQSIEIGIDRQFGHAEPITVSIAELPHGVTSASVISEMKTEQEKKVTLELTADRSINGQPIRIKGIDDQGRVSYATFDLRQDSRKHSMLWLSSTGVDSTDSK